MTIDKLPSGSYRIRQQYKGKRYTVVVPFKPTQKEALKLLSNELDKAENNGSILTDKASVDSYIEKYISKREKDGKSPSTIRNYISIRNNLSDVFMSKRFSELSQEDIQEEVNKYAVGRSAKSVSNMHGLIHSTLALYRPTFTYSIKLPSVQKKAEYEPTTKDIQRIIDASAGSRYECAYKCAVLGLRRGEFCAITAADLDNNNVLTINKDIVLDKNNKYVLKDKPKTEDSNRRILIPEDVANLIRKQGCVYSGDPHSINKYLHTYQDKLGIPRFRLHMMRHFAVAYLHKQGFTDQQIMSYGGWSNSSDVMKRAYRYNLDPEDSQKEIANVFNNIL